MVDFRTWVEEGSDKTEIEDTRYNPRSLAEAEGSIQGEGNYTRLGPHTPHNPAVAYYSLASVLVVGPSTA